MPGYTPGPWRLMTNNTGLHVAAGTEDLATVYAPRWPAPSQWEEVEAEGRANAALMAAAPDLLAALEELRDEINSRQRAHDCPGFDCATCTPAGGLHAAEQAIAKATGGEA
jgi:hypothetical protein